MRNFDEKMIQRSKNLRKKRKLPPRWIHRLARAFRMGRFIPMFDRADDYAIEASMAQHRRRVRQRKYNNKRVKQHQE